jgi:glycosyltransferase involved in cell wall biosynthesis
MTVDKPLVSVGLPLYNAGEHTRRILDILVSQDYTNLEIVVSDNASTDHTWTICQEYANRDNRIRLHKNQANYGYIFNFDRVFRLATGTYFMWAAHDDHWDTKFIGRCVDVLQTHPEAIFCFTDQIHINAETSERKTISYSDLMLQDSRIMKRIRSLLSFRPRPHAIIYGMFRREAIIAALPIPSVPSADIAFLFRVMLEGPAIHIPEVLYERKVTRGVEFRSRMEMIRPNETLPPSFVIVLETLYAFLKYAWGSSETLMGKIRMTPTIIAYPIASFGLQFVPSTLRPTVRHIKQLIVSLRR